MHVEVTWQGGMSFQGQTPSGHRLVMDAAETAGGQNGGARPMELILVALGGCTAMDVISILKKMKQNVGKLDIAIEGERAEEHPKVYTDIRLVYRLEGEGLQPDKVGRALQLSQEKYCSVSHMLNKAAPVSYVYEVNGERFNP